MRGRPGRLQVLPPGQVDFWPGFRMGEILHPHTWNFVQVGKIARCHIFEILQECSGVQVFNVPGDDRGRNGNFGHLVAIRQVSIGHAVVAHHKQRTGETIRRGLRVAVGVEGHGIAAIGEGVGALVRAGQAESAHIFQGGGGDDAP